MQEVKKEMTVNEVLEKYPKTIAVFMDYGLHCVGCPIAQSETIKALAQGHQLDLKKLLGDLNKAAKE